MHQPRLFRGHHLPSVYRYSLLFGNLPSFPSQEPTSARGRKPYAPDLLLRLLIYRALRQIPTLSELAFELGNNPSLVDCLGLDPLRAVPSVERFSHFLRVTPNSVLQQVRFTLVQGLIEAGAVTGKIVAMDSCPVEVRVRENNLKTGFRASRFDKTRPPKGDPEARLGVRIHFPRQRQKKVTFFWGYRNHTITDVEAELPLCEHTHPANVSELKTALSLLPRLQELPLGIEFVTADAEYDAEVFLQSIVNLGAQPIVARNPGSEQKIQYSIRNEKIYCPADLPMSHRGKMTVKATGITYRQYSCPLHWSKSLQRRFLFCPIAHPKFFEQKGCNVLLRMTPSVRSRIPYGSELYQRVYTQRTGIERSFSRLLTLTLQHPTVRGLQAIQNHCTIAHIATLLVALTAARLGEKDKIRWVKSFLPRFLKK
jgi:hypothetical protein